MEPKKIKILKELNKALKLVIDVDGKEIPHYGITDAKDFWTKQIKIEERYEKKLTKILNGIFDRQEKEVLARLGKQYRGKGIEIKINIPFLLLSLKKENKKMAVAVTPLLSNDIKETGQYALNEMGVAMTFEESAAVATYLDEYPIKFAKSVNTTTNNRLKKQLVEGISQGEGIDEISKRVSGVFKSATVSRAKTIARTEVSRATNFATVEGYKQSGVVKGKEWVTAFDERTCFPAQTKIKTKKGYVGIQNVKIGDYVLTHKDRYRKVLKLHKRRYDGEFVRINLKGGGKLSATSEHPILINGEWKEIKDIKIGDKINHIARKCSICGKLIPIYKELCRSCSARETNKIIWKDPKQHKRVSIQNRILGKVKKMRKAFDLLMKNSEFKRCFGVNVSKGLKKKYREDKGFHNMITESNREKGRRPDWGWKNKERQAKALKIAFKKRGENHLGKTYLEKKVEWWLNKEEINYKPQKYFNNGERRFWVDFYLPDYNLIIEADGEYFHNEIDDRKRDKDLKKVFTGQILHWKGEEIKNNFIQCIESFNNVILQQNCFTELEVRRVKKWKLKGPQTVYNLTVDEDNTYTANNIVVHNCEFCSGMDGKIVELDDDYFDKGDEYKVGDNSLNLDYDDVGEPPLHSNCRCTIIPIIK